jgi:hypothetical protein
MCKVFVKKFNNQLTLPAYLIKSYLTAFKYILRFLKKFWIVFVAFIPLGFALGKLGEFDLKNLLLCFVGCKIDYNGEWWYVKQYIFMLLLMPAIHLCFDFILVKTRRNIKVVLVGILMVAIYFLMYYFIGYNKIYILVFLGGYVCSRFNLFELLDRIIPKKFSYLIAIVAIACCFVVRVLLATSASYNTFDFIITPVFVYAICLLTKNENIFNKFLAWLGKYSVYMWLTHTFYCYYYFQEIITFSKISTVMYVEIIIISLLTAIVLSLIEKIIDKYIINNIGNLIKNKKREKVYGTN